MRIDHIFIRTRAGAPEAELLLQLGLLEGSGNRHPGQGTENRRFFFHNAFLELLWIADADEIQSKQTRPTKLFEHLSSDEASPFGICFRPSDGADTASFPTWEYAPPYLPPGMKIDIGADTPLDEPMWFFLAQGTAPEAYSVERQQPLRHALGLNQITSLTVTMPGIAHLSRAAMAAKEAGLVTFRAGDEHLLEVVFDGHRQGKTHDFRPHLPLTFSY